jgi:hypothetical protein
MWFCHAVAAPPSFSRKNRESGIHAQHTTSTVGVQSMAMPDSIELAAKVVAAYVSNNPLPKDDLPDLILAVQELAAGIWTGR